MKAFIDLFNSFGWKFFIIFEAFKIAGIGILVAVLNLVLTKAGREDQAMMTTLTGVIIVLMLVISQISTLFETVRTVFKL